MPRVAFPRRLIHKYDFVEKKLLISSLLFHLQSGQDYPPLSSSPLQLTPTLVDSQIQRIADTAETLIKAMSETVEAKQIKNNKKVSKEVEVSKSIKCSWQHIRMFYLQMVLAMSDDDPRKMEEIRRFSAIYGRFDCKRKPEKPLTLHEVISQYDTLV